MINEYRIYMRVFLDTLRVYLDKNHRDHKNNKKMWELSKDLKYYVHLIFKTKKYKNKFFTNEEIIEEIKILNSFLSEPLHGNSIYYKKIYISKRVLNKKIEKIIKIILKFGINDDVIKIPINPKIKGNKQNYLKYTKHLVWEDQEFEKFLKFIKNNCLKEVNKEIEELKKWKL